MTGGAIQAVECWEHWSLWIPPFPEQPFLHATWIFCFFFHNRQDNVECSHIIVEYLTTRKNISIKSVNLSQTAASFYIFEQNYKLLSPTLILTTLRLYPGISFKVCITSHVVLSDVHLDTQITALQSIWDVSILFYREMFCHWHHHVELLTYAVFPWWKEGFSPKL